MPRFKTNAGLVIDSTIQEKMLKLVTSGFGTNLIMDLVVNK